MPTSLKPFPTDTTTPWTTSAPARAENAVRHLFARMATADRDITAQKAVHLLLGGGKPRAVRCSSKTCPTSGMKCSSIAWNSLYNHSWDRAGASKWTRERFGMALARGQARTTTYVRGVRYTVWPASIGERSAISEEGARGGWEEGRGGADAPVTVLYLLHECTVRFCNRSNTVTALKVLLSGQGVAGHAW